MTNTASAGRMTASGRSQSASKTMPFMRISSERTSWQRSSPRGQQQLAHQQERRQRQRPAIELGVAHVGAGPHRLAFELIDLAINIPQGAGVVGREVPAAGGFGDVGEER